MCSARFEKKIEKYIGKENLVYLIVQKITLTCKTFKRIIVISILFNVLISCNQFIVFIKDESCVYMLQTLAA